MNNKQALQPQSMQTSQQQNHQVNSLDARSSGAEVAANILTIMHQHQI